MSGRWFGLVLALFVVDLRAQDVQPRAFTPAPTGVNTVGLGYTYSTGAVLFDKTIPIDDANGDIHAFGLVYSRSIGLFGMSGRVDAVLPFATGTWSGEVAREQSTTSRTGLGDPTIRLALFFVGAPAMTPEEYAQHRSGRRTMLGAMLRLSAPLGQYDPELLINIGSNRWSVSPQLGFSHISGRMLVEAYASAWLLSANSEFLGTMRREQDPLFAFQLHVGYLFKRGFWLAVSTRQSFGGAVRVDGGDKLEPETNNRIGLTLAIPIYGRVTLRLVATTPLTTRIGNDYDSFGASLQTSF